MSKNYAKIYCLLRRIPSGLPLYSVNKKHVGLWRASPSLRSTAPCQAMHTSIRNIATKPGALASVPPEVVIRRATPRDQAGVIGMGDMPKGMDYLNFMFPFYMSSPDFYCYLLERKGRPVCFVYMYIVDDGDTMIAGGGRTDPEFQGKGYMGMLGLRATADTLQQLEREPSRFIATSFDSSFHRERTRRQPDKYDIFITRHLVCRKATKDNISSIVYSNTFQELERTFLTQIWTPTDQEIQDLLTDRKTKDLLFPDGYFLAYWEPYKATVSNMTLARKTSKIFVSGDRSAGIFKALSLVSEIPVSTGLRYDLEFYGSGNTDVMQHLYNYMRNLTTLPLLADVVIEMVLYLPLWIDIESIEQQIANYGWEFGSWSAYPTYIAIETRSFKDVAPQV